MSLATLTSSYGNVAEIFLWIVLVAFGTVTFGVRMVDLPPAMSIILKFMFISFAAYLIFPLTLPSNIDVPSLTAIRLSYSHLILPLICILGLWRPGVGVTGMAAAMAGKISLGQIIGETLSKTEYAPLIEVSLFMVVGAALIPVLKRLGLTRLDGGQTREDSFCVLEKFTLIAIGVHLSNYFYSGVKKLFLGEHALSWTLYNETWSLILTANALGSLPLSFDQSISNIGIQVMRETMVLSNALILVSQLFAIIASVRIRYIIIATVFYDLTHVLIFLATGIFFYKWIILNLAIVAALVGLRDKIIPKSLRFMIAGMIVVAPLTFFVAELGWWDTRSLNHEKFYAVLDDRTEMEVPTNYWGSFSVIYAQLRRIRNKEDGFFPTGTSGIIFGQDNMKRGLECNFTLPPSKHADVVSKVFSKPDNDVVRHVKMHHRYVLENVNDKGRLAYDVYPHHIWSMPWLFRNFSLLDKRRIVAYKYVVEATCLGYEKGRMTKDIKRRSEYVIQL